MNNPSAPAWPLAKRTGGLSLRMALPLLWLLAVAMPAAMLLVLVPAGPADDNSMWLATLCVLLAAAAALTPLVRQLVRRAAEADALAARVAELQVQLAHAERQRRETLDKLSHDLRTPLASMQGYLELLLLRQGSLDAAETLNYLQTAARHSERLSRLVSDLFELTRLESQTALLHREPFPVAELAHDVAQRFGAAATQARVQLAVRAEQAQPLIVDAEVALVERVLGNLVDNALRHTPCDGRVTIEVEAAAGGARIAVADTGTGIADLEGIFERYEGASRTGDTGSRGAGLGLAIARRIAALHGCALELDSRPGAGTRVSFMLPLAAPNPDKTRRP